MRPVPTRDGCLLVVDVSRAQGDAPPWRDIVAAGAKAVIVKATEGVSYTDQRWHANAREAAEAGLMVGAYHVLRPGRDPVQQARHFRDVAHDRCALSPVLDFELQDGLPGQEVVVRAVAFLAEVERIWQKRAVVYCGPGFLGGLRVGAETLAPLGRYPLWLADYRDAPHVPAPWSSWAMWQWDDGHRTRIADVPLDLSWWRGSEVELAALGAAW